MRRCHGFYVPLLTLLLSILVSGCWDKQEIEEQAFSVVVGVDPKEGSGIQITYQIANPQIGSSDRATAQEEPPSDIITFSAPDLITGRDLANAMVTRNISFAHTKTLVVSEQFARSKLFKHFIGASIRDRQLRREVNLIVSKESAADFIRSNKPILETRPHKYFEFMQTRWKETGLVPFSTLNRLFQRTEGDDTLFLAIYATGQKGKDKEEAPNAPRQDTITYGNEDSYMPGQIGYRSKPRLQFMGSAVLRDGRMIGTMTGEETRLALLLRPSSIRASTWMSTYTDPLDSRFRVGVRLLRERKPTVSIDISGSRPRVQAFVPITAHLINTPSLIDYIANVSNQELLKQSIEEQLSSKAKALIKRTQTEFKGEPFTWYLSARQKFATYQQYQAYDWIEQYPRADVEVTFSVSIQQFGKQLQPFEEKWQEEVVQ
ncbi:Ger(x)C family spore germination C-terminal domain-containing protein [Paenibacillus sp. YYML68]|uniref:Ger(x)C family spore germination protein n=1 Tax=Paenibacillus sp. YYML68 TaxID=2909250 RepID=UPI0024920AB2|nr:Ger(x)C family spore germination C-terminal domain-containing protein [Paenibacillus sp. YYML68]